MALVPGYNFVRAGALVEFQKSFEREYREPKPESMSAIAFLRRVQHRQPPPHRCLQVTGFDRLWAVCEDEAALRTKIKQLLTTRGNWMMNHLSCVYFTFPPEVEFVEGATVQLRLPSGEHVDLDLIFGRPTQQERDHYHRPFALS